MNNNPIGLFDSGVGGTSIWKEIHQLLPYENTIYLADSLNAPYGNKSKEEITSLSVKNTELLLENNLLREPSNQSIIQFITNSSDITLKHLLKKYLEKVDIETRKF